MSRSQIIFISGIVMVFGILGGVLPTSARTLIDSPDDPDPIPPSESTVISEPSEAPEVDTGDYKIRPGDEIVIDLVGEEWGGSFVVPENGNLNFRFIGTVDVRDLTRKQLEEEIRSRLQPDYFRSPELRINFESFAEIKILVMGSVGQPKRVKLPQGAGLMEALLEAGALTKNSERTNVFVFRNDRGETSVYHANYERYVQGDLDQNLPLKHEDLVYVPTNFWPHFDTLDQVLRTMGFATTISRDIRTLGE